MGNRVPKFKARMRWAIASEAQPRLSCATVKLSSVMAKVIAEKDNTEAPYKYPGLRQRRAANTTAAASTIWLALAAAPSLMLVRGHSAATINKTTPQPVAVRPWPWRTGSG